MTLLAQNSETALWSLEFSCPLPSIRLYEPILEEFFQSVSWWVDEDKNQAYIQGIGQTFIDTSSLYFKLTLAALALGEPSPPCTLKKLENRDWLAFNKQTFQVKQIGRYWVYGSHHEQVPPAGSVKLLIDAATAFGAGEHATTFGCLLALSKLAAHRRFYRPLDMGCGSGILAIAIAKTWKCTTVAIDNDKEAVRVTKRNSYKNQVNMHILAFQGQGFTASSFRHSEFYDLIVANILARPLCLMAQNMAALLTDDGIIILSGLLASQQRQVMAPYLMQKIKIKRSFIIDGWATLVLMRG